MQNGGYTFGMDFDLTDEQKAIQSLAREFAQEEVKPRAEEMDREDWEAQWDDGALEAAEAPEDWSGSVDVDVSDDEGRGSDNTNEDPTLRAGSLDGIDLFEFD